MTVTTNTAYTVYSAAGVILRTGTAPEDQIHAQADTTLGESVLYVPSVIATDKVDVVTAPTVPVVVTKPVATGITYNKLTFTANGTDEVIFSTVPSTALVTIRTVAAMDIADIVNLAMTGADTTHLIITATQVGAYTVTITDGLNHQDYTVTLNAN